MKVLKNLGVQWHCLGDDYSQLLFRGETEERTLHSEILNGGFAPTRSDSFSVHISSLQGLTNSVPGL
jgi:hypothetical protein